MVNGQAHHPQSQGLVERANDKVEQMLACRFHSAPSADSPWTLWLPEIQCKILLRHIMAFIIISISSLCTIDQLNTVVHEAIKATPYEVVFGQLPLNNIFPAAMGVVMEEDVGEFLKEGAC